MWPIRNFGGFQSNHRKGTAYSRPIKHVCYIDFSNSITYNQQQECGCGYVTVFKFRHDAARHTSLSATTELLVLFNLCSGVCNVTNGLQTFVLCIQFGFVYVHVLFLRFVVEHFRWTAEGEKITTPVNMSSELILCHEMHWVWKMFIAHHIIFGQHVYCLVTIFGTVLLLQAWDCVGETVVKRC